LKLVITGNHDLELGKTWVRKNLEDEEDLQDHKKCVENFAAQDQHGVHYLTEGTYRFDLQDGRRFTIYASPYTPEFNGYTFAYEEEEDRFDCGKTGILESVDIVMTHGPPRLEGEDDYALDRNENEVHCGCEKLANAIQG
jgi:hypothetical protein